MEERLYAVMREREDRHWWFRGRRAVIGSLLGRADLPASPKILDAGCGTGRNLELYSQLGEVSGVDTSPEAIAFCHERGFADVGMGDAENLPFEDGQFDLVAATDVLEHVEHDGAGLTEMHRVSKPGGHLLLTVPANAWMWSDEDVHLGHYRRYRLSGLRDRASENGWEPVFGTYFNLILLPPIALARKLPVRRGSKSEVEQTPELLDTPMSWPMRFEAALIRAGLRLPAGVSLGLVCRRA